MPDALRPAAIVDSVINAVDSVLADAKKDILAAVAARASGAPDAPRPAQTDPVLADFYEHARSLRQAEIDFLLKRQGVPIMALCQDGDGGGWPLCAARVTFHDGNRFEFADYGDEAVGSAIVTVLRDRDDYVFDLVAWAPRSGQFGSHLGRAALVGEHELGEPRFDKPLRVHRGFLDWLRAGRRGAVVLDTRRAWQLLQGEEVEAADVEHGLELRRVLRAPAPRIVVPERDREAA